MTWHDMGMIWHGAICWAYDMFCYDMLCFAAIWYDMLCCDVSWHDTRWYVSCDMIRCGVIWYEMTWYSMIPYDMMYTFMYLLFFHMSFSVCLYCGARGLDHWTLAVDCVFALIESRALGGTRCPESSFLELWITLTVLRFKVEDEGSYSNARNPKPTPGILSPKP